MTCFVYVIAHRHGDAGEDVTGPCKVGISEFPYGRLWALSTGPHELVMCKMFQFPDRKMAWKFEQQCHVYLKDAFKGCELKGEWFDLSPTDTCREVAGMVAVDLYFIARAMERPEAEKQLGFLTGTEMGPLKLAGLR